MLNYIKRTASNKLLFTNCNDQREKQEGGRGKQDAQLARASSAAALQQVLLCRKLNDTGESWGGGALRVHKQD